MGEEWEDPIAFHHLPEHQHVVVGGVGIEEVARQNSAGVVIHEQHQVDPPVALQPGPEEVSICTSSPKASLSKRRQGLRKWERVYSPRSIRMRRTVEG